MTNSECTTCLGTGTDVVFGGPCTDCDEAAFAATARFRTGGRFATSEAPFGGFGDGTGSGGARTADVATEAQLRFIASLGHELAAGQILTKREASKLIDQLKSQPKATEAAPSAARRPNRFGGRCVKCGQTVAAEAGYLAKDAAGRWAAEHKQYPTEAAAVEEGFYIRGDSTIKVQRALKGDGLYTKVLDPETGDWNYVPGLITRLGQAITKGEARQMTLEEAKAYGRLYGRCCDCGRRLTDEASIAEGIGPICAAKW